MNKYIIKEFAYKISEEIIIDEFDNINDALSQYKQWCFLNTATNCEISLYRIDEDGKQTLIRKASFMVEED